MNQAQIVVGDACACLQKLKAQSVQAVITSPPYWKLRDYGHSQQLGLESTPEQFVENLCKVFDQTWRVLRDDGTLWLNLADTYCKDKSLAGIPWRVALALQARGWILRSDIIWHKPNVMPESTTDRPTKSHEYIFLLTKSPNYFYNADAVREPVSEVSLARAEYGFKTNRPSAKNVDGIDVEKMGERFVNPLGRNKRTVWTVPAKGYKDAHFATYPPELITPCVLAGSREGDTILDPFSGSGTTGEVALMHNRNYVGIELNPEYAELSRKRITGAVGMFGEVQVTL